MIVVGTAVAAAAATVLAAASMGYREPERTYLIGGGGWIFERFGADVTVLRASLNAQQARGDGVGRFLLSCEGREHRLVLDLPMPAARRIGNVPLSALIRLPSKAASQVSDAVLAIGSVQGNKRMILSDRRDSAETLVLKLARVFQTFPFQLDIIFHNGTAPVTLNQVSSIHLKFTFSHADRLAIDGFLGACSEPAR